MYRRLGLYVVINGKSSAEANLHFELYPPLSISLISSNNVNTVEWLVSVSAARVFVGSALSISFSIASRDYTFDGILL